MKVGILTYHNADNYGAVLQCYALQEVLKSMGHDVFIIDYRNPSLDAGYKVYKYGRKAQIKNFILLRVNRIIQANRTYNKLVTRRALFEAFRKSRLNRTDQVIGKDIPRNFDAYIIGSDQMWTLACTSGYEPVYFGEFVRPAHSRLIGYAISSNADFVSDLSLEKLEERVNDFTHLSFRENKTFEIIYRLTGRHTQVVLDPTLLTNEGTWLPLINEKWKNRKYVAVYRVDRAVDTTLILKKARDYSKLHGLELIDAGEGSVEDFVSIIRYAKCVFTSSFHAAVFASIFGTPLCCFKLHDGSDGRFVSYLNSIGEEKHLYELTDDVCEISSIDKHRVSDKLEKIRQSSLTFLIESLCK